MGEGGKLPIGKESVRIQKIERSGHYALRLYFDDTHDSGIYTWEYFRTLVLEKDQRWQDYLEELRKRGQTRNPNIQVVKFINPKT